ncbi:hypothetical protein [Leptolyngbya subtilissima]|uniref:Uncharacterized protein n=2 Tax=Cyanophyceae TaxID=3028117 RepID=A0ABV0KBZ3_9CYAN
MTPSTSQTSLTLGIAAGIADRVERRGQQITPEDAIARAKAAQAQMAKFVRLRAARSQPLSA